MSTAAFGTGRIVKLVGLLVLFFGLWFTPVPGPRHSDDIFPWVIPEEGKSFTFMSLCR